MAHLSSYCPAMNPRALELIRHDLTHILAEAVQTLWPGTRTAIGPAIEHGFYYDFERDTPFTPDDLPVIEAKMREIIAARMPLTREEWTRDQARAHSGLKMRSPREFIAAQTATA